MGCEQRGNLRARHARDGNAFRAAFFPSHDSNSRYGHLQTLGQQAPQRFIRAVIHRRSRQAHLQRALMLALDRIAARPRRHSHRKHKLPISLLDFNHEAFLFAR